MSDLKILTQLKSLVTNNKLPHAILLTGEQTRSFELAKKFSQWLLCDHKFKLSPNNCNCKNCVLFNSNHHPDFLIIDLGIEEEIKIETIRSVNEFINTNPYLLNCKILVINNIHNLNLQAANAFLKSLEEPDAKNFEVTCLLISSKHKILPATILSRVICLNCDLEISKELINSDLLDVLQLEIIQDLHDHWVLEKLNFNEIVNKWQKIPKQQLIDCLWFVVTKLIKNDKHELLLAINKKISSQVTWLLLDSLNYINKLIILGATINWQLFLYNFLLTKVTGENIYATRTRS